MGFKGAVWFKRVFGEKFGDFGEFGEKFEVLGETGKSGVKLGQNFWSKEENWKGKMGNFGEKCIRF